MVKIIKYKYFCHLSIGVFVVELLPTNSQSLSNTRKGYNNLFSIIQLRSSTTIIIANFLCTIFTRFLSPSKDFNPVIIAVNRSKRRTLHRDGHFSPRWNGLGFRYTLETHYSVAKSRASVIVDWLKLFAQPIRTSWRQWPRSKEIENYGYQRGWNPCPFLRSLRFIAVKTRRY